MNWEISLMSLAEQADGRQSPEESSTFWLFDMIPLVLNMKIDFQDNDQFQDKNRLHDKSFAETHISFHPKLKSKTWLLVSFDL
jgi:hypothetical protein